MKIKTRHISRFVIDTSDKFNIWMQDLLGINAKRKILEKKQDFVTLKELDNTIGKALGITGKPIEKQADKDISGKAPQVIEKPKLRDKSDQNEYQISDKDLNDFISFAKKAKLIIDSKNSRKLSTIDFQDLHFSDFEISLYVSIENTYSFDGELSIYNKDSKISSDSLLAYKTFKGYFWLSVSNEIDEETIHLFIDLFNKPNTSESFFYYYENYIIELLNDLHLNGEWAEPYDEKFYFKDSNLEIDNDTGWRDFKAFEEFDGIYSDLDPIDFKEEIDGIDSVKINSNILSYKFNQKDEFKHLAIMLMASYQKNIADQINKKLIEI